VTGGWRKLHNEELHNFYSAPGVITMMMRWAGHVACIGGRREMHIELWWETQKEEDHWEDLDVGGRIILKWILESYGGVCGLD
jgi:hypothetical protein